MKITLLAVGKIKESYLEAGIKEYVKRLGRYCKLEILEVADEKTPDGASENQERQIREKEGKRLLNLIRPEAYVITLEIQGKQLSSTELAGKLERLGVEGVSHITLVIGGSLGLSGEVVGRADFHLSFSPMTFPHQLMRMLVLEQLYRCYRIINGEPYHK